MKFLSKKYRSICKRSAATIALVLVSVSANAGMYFVHSDQVGAPTKLSDSSARVVWRAENRGYGEGVYNDHADGNGRKVTMNVRYPGQYHDAESGLHYNYFRYYDPKLGRYITSDPIGLAGGINTYEYVGGNPVKFVDPYGLQGFDQLDLFGSFSTWSYLWQDGLGSNVVNGRELIDGAKTHDYNASTGIGFCLAACAVVGEIEGRVLETELNRQGAKWEGAICKNFGPKIIVNKVLYNSNAIGKIAGASSTLICMDKCFK